MNRAETALLMKIIGDVKRIEFSPDDVRSWQLVLDETPFGDAQEVTVKWLRAHPGEWMEAGHVHQGVREIQSARRQAYGTLVPEHVWPEMDEGPFDPELYQRRMRELAHLVNTGRLVRGPGSQPELLK